MSSSLRVAGIRGGSILASTVTVTFFDVEGSPSEEMTGQPRKAVQDKLNALAPHGIRHALRRAARSR